ncbi:MAG: hypothetical protein ACFFAO_16750, partial [Candidatus Hermodarchaeota archaeon]
PEDAKDIHPIRYLYRSMITQTKGALVEVEKEYLGSLLAIKTIFKFPQDPTGFTFLASYTVPRENFSFILKIQCPEFGPTGIREAMILDKALAEGLVDIKTKKGWFFDPYDPDFTGPVLSNIADKQEYDKQFPDHPLSRARDCLKLIKEKAKFSDEVLNSEKFFLNLS